MAALKSGQPPNASIELRTAYSTLSESMNAALVFLDIFVRTLYSMSKGTTQSNKSMRTSYAVRFCEHIEI